MIMLILFGLLLTIIIEISDATNIKCANSEFCREVLRKESNCVDGFCDNPFQYGCINSLHLPGREDRHQRICNSEDPSDASDRGLCREGSSSTSGSGSSSGLEYQEVRIFSQNWESAIFGAWIAQIVLSELLDVPVTIETGDSDVNVNFYDRRSRFQYGSSQNHFDGFERASNFDGDCRKANKEGDDDSYESCGHAMLEVWSGFDQLNDLADEGLIELPSSLGVIGEDRWFVPKSTAKQDPSLMSYHGLKGLENRKKLADRFNRPTTWADYCNEISEDNCTGDGPAQRSPVSEEEGKKYFSDGLYIGHFRATQENNCTASPTTCTGHFLDYPCDFSAAGYFMQNVNNLKIGLKSNGSGEGGGYTIPEMIDIWLAANSTKSDIIGMWWRPEALYRQFQGTDFELQAVNLPNPSSECLANRIGCGTTDDNITMWDSFALPQSDEATCDIPPQSLHKLISTELPKMMDSEFVDLAHQSPAFDVLNRFTLNSYDLEKIFGYWLLPSSTNNVDKYGYDPRDAVCRWIGENFEELERRFIPPTFPRKIEERRSSVLQIVALVFGAIAVVTTIIFTGKTYLNRKTKVFVYAQVQFVFLLLFGLLLVSISAITTALPPTNGSCIASVWLINIGYTFEIAPLIVKIAAINKFRQAAKKLKRIKLSKEYLYGAVAGLAGIVTLYMIIWTVIDRPKKEGDFKLLETANFDGSTTISYAHSCRSNSSAWTIISIGIQVVLLLCGSLLSFMTRKTKNDINETSTVAFLIYSNFVFVLLRVILVFLEQSIDVTVWSLSLSLILSVDVLAAIGIYLIPKFLKVGDNYHDSLRMTATTISSLRQQSQGPGTVTIGWNRPVTDVSDPAHSYIERGDLTE